MRGRVEKKREGGQDDGEEKDYEDKNNSGGHDNNNWKEIGKDSNGHILFRNNGEKKI